MGGNRKEEQGSNGVAQAELGLLLQSSMSLPLPHILGCLSYSVSFGSGMELGFQERVVSGIQ